MSLKDRIREAQIEAAKRLKVDSRRNGGRGTDGDESEEAPTVEEIRLALLRKSANGKTIE